jgi:hypothetical protein
MTGIQAECDTLKRVKAHLKRCLQKPEYYNYASVDLVADYQQKMSKIDEFLAKFDNKC